jgi:hypothetical protein
MQRWCTLQIAKELSCCSLSIGVTLGTPPGQPKKVAPDSLNAAPCGAGGLAAGGLANHSPLR